MLVSGFVPGPTNNGQLMRLGKLTGIRAETASRQPPINRSLALSFCAEVHSGKSSKQSRNSSEGRFDGEKCVIRGENSDQAQRCR